MCGIAGILKIYEPGEPVPHHLESIPEAWLDTLDESIKHRGPDGQGRFRDRAVREDGSTVDVAFVHRRLSIIDHAGGHQPMVHDGRHLRPDLTYQPGEEPKLAHELCPGEPLVAVVFNGCIYNHRELRAELTERGFAFETDHSDTESILQAFRSYGHWSYDRIADNSMFALGVWDRLAGNLTMARDWFGQKPLYMASPEYSEQTEEAPDLRTLAVSSSAAGLAGIFGDSELRGDATKVWVAYGHSLDSTPFQCAVSIGPRSIHIIPFNKDLQEGSPLDRVMEGINTLRPPDAAESDTPDTHVRSLRLRSNRALLGKIAPRIDKLVRQCVSEQLEADVPVACLLSGGVDSSLIAFHAQNLSGRINTISVRMNDPRYDETPFARAAAECIGSSHTEVDADPNASADLVTLIETAGIPFGDSSLLPTFWACRAASSHAKVLLTGDGGDELFVGYRRHLAAKWLPWGHVFGIPSKLLPSGLLRGRTPYSTGEQARRLIEGMRRESYITLLAIFGPADAKQLLHATDELFPHRDLPLTPLDAAYADSIFTLPSDYLRKVDLASMAVPVETRAPLLSRRLQQAAMEFDDLNYSGGLKAILRRAAKLHLPAHIIDRPKQGFAIPVGEWFRSDFGGMRQLLLDHLRSSDPFPGLGDAGVEINMKFVEQMLREHDAAGEKSINPWHGRDHSQRLYMLLVLSIWAKWLDRTRREAGA